MSVTTITTRYESRPNSNVGKYVARSLGRQRSVTTDQALGSHENHERAAKALAAVLADLGITGTLRHVRVEDDGRHLWSVDQ